MPAYEKILHPLSQCGDRERKKAVVGHSSLRCAFAYSVFPACITRARQKKLFLVAVGILILIFDKMLNVNG